VYAHSDGSNAHLVGEERWRGGPHWTPDSRSVTVRADRGLTAIDVSTGRPRTLLANVGPIDYFGWSPDGSALAVSTYGPVEISAKPGSAISVVAADGTHSTVITPGDSDIEPDWQPVCTLYGTARDDTLTGTNERDVICGLGGDDRIAAGRGDDLVIGGDGDDLIFGGPGHDRLFGAAGDDVVHAADGEPDVVDGGPGHDRGDVDARGGERVAEVESAKRLQ
jgi:Ca2+-binding RTX toxin-like protein